MTTYIILRHGASVEYIRQQFQISGEVVEHCDAAFIRRIKPGDRAIGVLPAHLAADISARGAKYFHFALDVPENLRGRELSLDEIKALNARLIPVPFAYSLRHWKSLSGHSSRFLRALIRLADGATGWLAQRSTAVKAAVAFGGALLTLMCAQPLKDALLAGQWMTALGNGAGLLVSAIITFALTRTIVNSDAHVSGRETFNAKVLIIGLSTTNPKVVSFERENFADDAATFALDVAGFAKSAKCQHLFKIDPGYRPSNWQQLVRSIHAHGFGLQKVLVLPSAESLDSFGLFRNYVAAICGEAIEVELVRARDMAPYYEGRADHPNRSYDSYDYVYRGLSRALEQVQETSATVVPEAEIFIDITAGIKMFSVAAAIITLNRKLRFAYVTNAGDPKAYDANISFMKPESYGLGT